MGYILGLISGIGLPGLLLIYLLLNPQILEKYVFWLSKAIHYLANTVGIYKNATEKKLIAAEIQASVNTTGITINENARNVLPHAIKIEWVSNETKESFIKDGSVVVRLKHYDNNDRNIVEATLLYLKKGLLPRAKQYLDESLRRSCEYMVASKMIYMNRKHDAMSYFNEHVLKVEQEKHELMKEDIEKLKELDEKGWMDRLFFNEVRNYSDKMLGVIASDTNHKTTRSFVNFLFNLSNSNFESRSALDYNEGNIKVSIILVADKDILGRYGLLPYIRRAKKQLSEGFESIYFVAIGKNNAKAVKSIVSSMGDSDLTVIDMREYSTVNHPENIIAELQPSSSYLREIAENKEEIVEAIKEVGGPNILDGLIIRAIGRVRGVGTKVAVSSRTGEDLNNQIYMVIKDGNNHEIKDRLGEKFFNIIPWSDSVEALIGKTLFPLKEDEIIDIQVDQETLFANVIVATNGAAARAVGKNGDNIKIANQITGYFAKVLVYGQDTEASTGLEQ